MMNLSSLSTPGHIVEMNSNIAFQPLTIPVTTQSVLIPHLTKYI